MAKNFKTVHGIKLEERTCTQCPLSFWVPTSSKQVTCSEFCLNRHFKTNYLTRGKKKKFTDKIKENDHAK